VGEVLGLCWSDLDEETGVLTIRRQVQHDVEAGQPCIVPRVKTPSGQREVPLPEYMITEWKRWKRQHDRERKMEGWQMYRYDGHAYDLVFTQLDGGIIPQRLDATWWKKLLLSTKLEDPETGKVTPVAHVRRYVARHSAASRMVAMENSDILSIAALLGHSSADFTLRKYSHALDEKKRKTIEDLNRTNTGRVERWKDALDDERMGRTGEDIPPELEEERAAMAQWEEEDLARQHADRDKRLEEFRLRKAAEHAAKGDSDTLAS
jgi:integrase